MIGLSVKKSIKMKNNISRILKFVYCRLMTILFETIEIFKMNTEIRLLQTNDYTVWNEWNFQNESLQLPTSKISSLLNEHSNTRKLFDMTKIVDYSKEYLVLFNITDWNFTNDMWSFSFIFFIHFVKSSLEFPCCSWWTKLSLLLLTELQILK